MLKQIVTCDVCGAIRKDANHWFCYSASPGQVTFWTWGEEIAARFDHVCGQVCAHKLLDEFLSK
jgi:hypothetical protein